MRKLLALLLTLWLAPAIAQVPMTGAGKGAPAVAPSYCGPGDGGSCNGTTGALAFYSCGRAYNAAYANGTNPLCDLVAITGGAAVCTLRAATTGYVDLTAYCPGSLTPSAACAAASGGSCLISKIYDQSGASSCSGACDLATTPGATTKPALTFSALNSLPCVTTSGTSALATSGTIASQSAPYSFTVVGKITSATNGRWLVSGATQGGILDNAANTVRMYAGSSLNATASDASFHALVGTANTTTTGAMVVDGSSTTGTTGTTAISSNIVMGTDSAGSSGIVAIFCEGGIWSGAINATNMNSNMHNVTSGWNF